MTSVDRYVRVEIVCVLQRPKLGQQACEVVLEGLERFCGDDVVLDTDRSSHSETVQPVHRVSANWSGLEAQPPTDQPHKLPTT